MSIQDRKENQSFLDKINGPTHLERQNDEATTIWSFLDQATLLGKGEESGRVQSVPSTLRQIYFIN